MNANDILGQPNFSSTSHSVTDSTLYHPTGIIEWKGYLCISDKLNNRVLLFQNGIKKADFVLGQPDFQSNIDTIVSDSTLNQPMGISADSNFLYVADFENNRILMYNDFSGKVNIVIGQSDMNTNTPTTSPNGLFHPTDVFSDTEHLFIVDRENNRVLIYDSIPKTSGASADYVIGHSDFYDGSSLPPSDSTLYYPYTVFSDGTHLFIADKYRVLIYDSIPQKNNAKADIIISGQGTASDSTFSGISDIYFDGNNLFLADYGYNRVLIIPNPFSNKKASIAIGQNRFTDSLPNQGNNAAASTLYHPSGIFLKDTLLYVTDTYNNRVLAFQDLQGISQDKTEQRNIANRNMFFLEKSSDVTIRLYDITGRQIENIFTGNLSKGYHRFPDIQRYHSGIYFLLINGQNLSIHKKVIVIR